MARMSFILFVLFSLGFCGCESTTQSGSRTNDGSKGLVQVVIDFNGRGEKKVFDVPCSEDSTVFSVLERGRNMGDVRFESTGSGETVFVSSIDGVENEKANGDNWTYRVNGFNFKETNL